MASLMVALSGAFVACDDDDDYDTNQISGGVSLSAASLQVTRGAYMTFKGNNLSQITEIIFPDNISVTSIEVVDSYTIRCIVPDEAVVGVVTLKYSGGTLTTGTIGFTEDIEFNDFSPKTAEPGDVITLEGLYLEYFTHARFATGDAVELTSVARKEATVTVPVDASTGEFYLVYYTGDGDELVATELASPEEITIAEPVVALSDTALKAGDVVTLTGSLLRIIDEVVFTTIDGTTSVSTGIEDPTADVESIDITVPDEATDGTVSILLLSGIEIEVGTITLTEPVASIVDTESTYGIGDVVTITGTDLDLIVEYTFAVSDGVTATTDTVTFDTDGNIAITVLAEAISGDITLTLANGNTITASGFVTTKPTVTLPEDATPLDELTLDATLASRIASFSFGGAEAEATSTDDSSVSVQVPLTAETGTVTITMDNGEVVEVGSMTVNDYTFCAVASFASDATTVGTLLQCTVVNGSALTDVLIEGVSTGYLLTNTTLYVSVGTTTGDLTMTLVSGETEVPYTITVQADGEVEEILWTGTVELEGWSANYEMNIDFSSAPSGASVRIYYTITGDYPQMIIYNGHWLSAWNATGDYADNQALLASSSYIDVDLSLFPYSDWGYTIILQGDGLIVSQIAWVYDYSAPTTIWTGTFECSNWNGMTDLAWQTDVYDWSQFTLGMSIYFYIEYTSTDGWGQLSPRSGTSWANFPSVDKFDLAEGDTEVVFTPTSDDIDDLQNEHGLVVTGHGYTLSSIGVK